MSRYNDRQAHESRAIQITFDGLARVDGSARFSMGTTSALSSVSGPIEVRLASENASHATLEVLVRPLSNVPATESKALAATVRGLLTPSLILANNPRTLVQIVVQTLVPLSPSTSSPKRANANANVNAVTAAAVNASTLALLNAGSIPMRGVTCAVVVGRRRDTGVLVVDPDEGDGALDADGCFAFMFTRDGGDVQSRCVWTNWRQSIGQEGILDEARVLAGRAAGDVYTAIQASVEGMRSNVDRRVVSLVQKEDMNVDDDKMEI